LISGRDDWVYVYSDSNSIIFVKNEDSQKDVLERLRRKELTYPKGISDYFP